MIDALRDLFEWLADHLDVAGAKWCFFWHRSNCWRKFGAKHVCLECDREWELVKDEHADL